MREKKLLGKKSKNISRWYLDVISQAELADYGPAKGTMIIRPYGYAVWENIVSALDAEIRASGAVNAYFPLLIPNSLFVKEKEHVEGFAPETAVVTYGGGEKLKDPLVVRPTSEMIMYEAYSRWISSWRDLPLVINQWNNVVRWEKRTYPFLRTSEFLWQEGHGAHAAEKENWQRVLWGVETYNKIYRDFFALECLVGEKSESEKFAGADTTLSCEVLVESGKVIQAATSHDLGQNFSKTLNICFQNKEGKNDYVWQNSWGFSTRSIGALILAHGDDSGLVFPPRLAPVKVVIVPILGKKDNKIWKYCQRIKEDLEKSASLFPGAIKISDNFEKSFGWRMNDADIKGIPVRIEVGPRELDEKTVMISFRLKEFGKKLAKLDGLSEKIEEMLGMVQKKMLDKHKEFVSKNTHEVKTYDEFKKIMKTTKGLISAYWCEDPGCEAKIKDETKATTRCKLLTKKEGNGKCICCKKDAKHVWYFGQAY